MKVLVLENDPRVLRGLERTLRVLGHEPLCSHAFSHAITLLEATPDVDLILADWGITDGESGLSLLAWAKAHQPHIRRVLISSALSAPEEMPDAVFERFRPKPFNHLELEELLKNLPSRSPLSHP